MTFACTAERPLDLAHSDEHVAVAEFDLQDRIVELAHGWVETGDPIMRPIAYEFPDAGLDDVTDSFLLGPDLLVAPVLEPGASTRTVRLPPGRWVDEFGVTHEGDATVVVAVTLHSVPRFSRVG